MTIPAAFSVTATVVGLLFALLTWAISSGPGWRELRWFAAACLCASGFTACSAVVTLPVGAEVLAWSSRASVVLAGAHGAAWFAYSAAQQRRRLSPGERAVVGVGLVLGLAAMIPGVVSTDEIVSRPVEWLGVVYRDVKPALFGEVGYTFFCAALLFLVVRYARAWRRRTPHAAAHAIGLGTLTAAAIHDSLATNALVPTPYVLDVGYLVVVCAVGGTLASRFVASARALEASATRLAEAQAELVQRERLAALGELSAVIAHEVRNPLGVIFNAVGALKRARVRSEDAEQLVGILDEEATRLKHLVDDLIAFARPETLRLEPNDLAALVRGSVEVARAAAEKTHVSVVIDVPAGLPPVRCDARLVRQAIGSLLTNAIQAARDTVGVRASIDAHDRVCIVVEDDGEGIAPEVRSRIFTPFFTTRAVGTGLGLVLVRRVAEAHHGDVEIESRSAPGAAFVLRLPL